MSALRRTTTLTALLLGAALLAPTGSASAAGETCRGEAATIVGADGTDVQGTEGRDVIVTNSSFAVFAGGGDDLVCVTGRARSDDTFVTMEAGDGNDVVDATLTPSGWSVAVDLGAGADEFQGGVGDDLVLSGPRDETDVDVLRGGEGSDELISLGGADGVYGDGGTDQLTAPTTTDGVLDGGSGRDEISVPLGDGTWLVKVSTGAQRDNVRTHRWTSIEGVTATDVVDHLIVKGTSGPDSVHVRPARGAKPLLDVATGRGDDSFQLSGGLEDTSGIELGSGRDEVTLGRDGDITLFLKAGTLVMGGVADVSGVEDATVSARTAVLIGTNARNTLVAGSCRSVVRGLGGADDLSTTWPNRVGVRCQRRHGASEIHGGGGRDVCGAAMRRTSCERTD